jgi:cobalt-zinc-cadmium efflux system outer membrane protein
MGAKPHLPVILALGVLTSAGCLSPVRDPIDALVCQRASVPVDPLPPAVAPLEQLPVPGVGEKDQADAESTGVRRAAGKEEQPPQLPAPKQNLLDRLQLPADVPGAEARLIEWPKNFKDLPPAAQDRIIARYFPVMLPMGAEPQAQPGPAGQPLTLQDLQRLARENSPLLRQAAGAIQAAEGAAWEAGMYPNPTVGFSGNTISLTSGSTLGSTFSQTIKTMGKLKLAQDMAAMDLANAQLAYRRAETDLMASVRTAYYGVLTAQAGIRANRALANLTDEVYNVMKLQLKVGEVAPYEPLQMSVFAAQSRVALVQARNSYLLAWKQLAAALGLPAMPPTQLAGSIDKELPSFNYEKCLARILASHTDVLTAQYTIQKQRHNLRLNEVTPVPDLTLNATVLYDATPPGPPHWVTLFGGSVPVPFFDRNQGGIKQAQGMLAQAIEEPHRVRAALTASVSDAFRRLEENRLVLEVYRKQMLPQQANAFRAAVLRHYAADAVGVAYSDLISAEQNVVTLIGSYLTTLQAYWQAVSDIASLLQTDNVYQMAEEVTDYSMPDLAELLKLPCCHPCSSLPNPALKGISSFESPPGQKVSPAILGVEDGSGPAPKTPAAPNESSVLPRPPEADRPAAPANLPTPIVTSPAADPMGNRATIPGLLDPR